MSKIQDNKFFKFMDTIFKIIIWTLAILILSVIVIQRVFNNKVALGNIRIFTIATGSMLPEYKIGDVIIVSKKDLDKIVVGDDLVYQGMVGSYKGKVITHRVISTNFDGKAYSFETKGINADNKDPIVSEKQVFGTVKYKPVTLSIISRILNNSFGFYFLIFVPISLLIFLEVLDFLKSREEQVDDGEEESKQN